VGQECVESSLKNCPRRQQASRNIAVTLQYGFISSILEDIHSHLLAQLLVVEELPPSLLDDLD
jgi:hypothetical protein